MLSIKLLFLENCLTKKYFTMKKHGQIFLSLLIACIIVTGQVFANGKEFKGIIVYNITYTESELDPGLLAMMPKTMKVMIKDHMSCTEMKMGMGNTIIIYNSEEKNAITLIDFMGQKYALQISPEEIEAEIEKSQEVSVEITDETKEIAGYTCKKAIIKIKEKGSEKEKEHYVYYTDELGSESMNYYNPVFKDIKGVMLEYVTVEDDISMKFTAISIDKKNVSDKEFEVPEGYKVVTKSEFESMFGGQ